ncbi:MAG: phage integrase SAM-like domain-containing protein, partial [Muribaculaceae bacterium]|nr:phage integrase SAM-like domain-containing protein [Muribaculaceae bacterium]
MASIKVKFRASGVAGHPGSIYYQIIHAKKVRQFLSGHRVYPDEWDEALSTVAVVNRGERQSLLVSVSECIRCELERLKRIAQRFDAIGQPYTADDVVNEFMRYVHEYSLFNFMEGIIARLQLQGKVRTAETYKSTLNSFRKFRGGEDIVLDCLSSETMEAYEAWHRRRGVAPNTISFYNRILRAVYNRAVGKGVIDNRHPFSHVYTGIAKTVKRALPIAHIRKIKALDLAMALDFARDMFMMSFYL